MITVQSLHDSAYQAATKAIGHPMRSKMIRVSEFTASMLREGNENLANVPESIMDAYDVAATQMIADGIITE